MKFFAVVAAASIAVASAANCDVGKLGPVVLGANGSQCTKDSGMSFLPPSVPSADVVSKLCASTACRALLTELKGAAPSECTVSISNPPLELYAQLLTPLEKTCGPPGGAPAPTPAAGQTTPAPGADQTKPTPAPTQDTSC